MEPKIRRRSSSAGRESSTRYSILFAHLVKDFAGWTGAAANYIFVALADAFPLVGQRGFVEKALVGLRRQDLLSGSSGFQSSVSKVSG
jgi:hypothetical protein